MEPRGGGSGDGREVLASHFDLLPQDVMLAALSYISNDSNRAVARLMTVNKTWRDAASRSAPRFSGTCASCESWCAARACASRDCDTCLCRTCEVSMMRRDVSDLRRETIADPDVTVSEYFDEGPPPEVRLEVNSEDDDASSLDFVLGPCESCFERITCSRCYLYCWECYATQCRSCVAPFMELAQTCRRCDMFRCRGCWNGKAVCSECDEHESEWERRTLGVENDCPPGLSGAERTAWIEEERERRLMAFVEESTRQLSSVVPVHQAP